MFSDSCSPDKCVSEWVLIWLNFWKYFYKIWKPPGLVSQWWGTVFSWPFQMCFWGLHNLLMMLQKSWQLVTEVDANYEGWPTPSTYTGEAGCCLNVLINLLNLRDSICILFSESVTSEHADNHFTIISTFSRPDGFSDVNHRAIPKRNNSKRDSLQHQSSHHNDSLFDFFLSISTANLSL